LGPHAGRVADGVTDRSRGRHSRDLADANAASERVLEPALVEIEVDWRIVGDPKYIGTIPLSGDPRCVAAQSHSSWPPVAVMSGIIAKVGAAARLSQSAAVMRSMRRRLRDRRPILSERPACNQMKGPALRRERQVKLSKTPSR
jgi:hypothetical protein